MAKIHNTDLTHEIVEAAQLQLSRDKLPTEIADKVVPVIEVNPKLFRNTTLFKYKADTGSGGTIFTTDSDKYTYITGVQMSLTKDVVSTITDARVGATLFSGEVVRLMELSFLTTTIANKDMFVSFTNPVKLKQGTTVSTTLNGGGVGAHRCSTCVFGYQVFNING